MDSFWASGTEALALYGMRTITDTFAWGHCKDTTRQTGFVATKAETAKCQKYHDLQSNYHFQPAAIETTGVYGKTNQPFFEKPRKETC